MTDRPNAKQSNDQMQNSQRDRLADLLCEVRHYRRLSDEELADALIARGVRVVDVATLATVRSHTASGCACDHPAVKSMLAALNAEAIK